MFKIRNLEIKNRVIAAPLAGISNEAYRKILFEMGAGLVYAEMVSDKALCYNNQKTYKMLEVGSNEHPLSMQIFGGDLESLVQAAKIVDKSCDCDVIDINMGCPVPKVVKTGAGSKLLCNLDTTYEMVREVVNSVSKPVTAKIRIGWDNESINVVETARMLEKAGVSAIAVHARTRSQFYSGEADWEYIKEVKEAVNIPVIGNGDIKSPQDAKRMLEQTGCDAVMIGRAYLGNPWIIKQTIEFLNDGIVLTNPSIEEKIEMCLYHASELIRLYKNELIAIKEMRSHVCWYLKGQKNSNRYKQKINDLETYEQLEKLLSDFLTENRDSYE